MRRPISVSAMSGLRRDLPFHCTAMRLKSDLDVHRMRSVRRASYSRGFHVEGLLLDQNVVVFVCEGLREVARAEVEAQSVR